MRTLLVVIVLLLLAGCSSAPKTAPQAFDIQGTKVEFSPPPPDWTQRAADPKDKDKPKKIVVFEAPNNAGYIGVGAVNGVKALDQKTLNDLGVDIVSAKGRIIKDKYIDVAGEKENAYRMEFEINSGAAKGVQVHFPRDGRLYSIVMTVKADKFNESEKVFDNVVSSFTIPGK